MGAVCLSLNKRYLATRISAASLWIRIRRAKPVSATAIARGAPQPF
jgi:hypothetical protein